MIAPQHRQLFLSAVTREFRSYRDLLAADLNRPTLSVKVQEDFGVLGRSTLEKLDEYIRNCHAVVHLIGRAAGAIPPEPAVAALLAKYPDLPARLPPLGERLGRPQPGFSYTQWEAYLAVYHGRPVFIYTPTPEAPRDPTFVPDPDQEQSQDEHHGRISALGRDRGTFATQERLSSAVLRDLVEILPGLGGPAAQPGGRGELPAYATPFVGRAAETAEIDRLLGLGRGLVVLTGGGGIGKTRLACEVARWLAAGGRFPGGCLYAELKDRASADRVAFAVQFALGRSPSTDREEDRAADPAEAVGVLLAALPPTLLVLNNLEPVGDLARQTVGRWRRQAPHVVLLVTAREQLAGVDDAQGVHLRGVGYLEEADRAPGWVGRVGRTEAARLFVDTARFGDPGFTLTEENADDVDELCRTLQGQPFPIILAARGVRNATPAEILVELRGRLHAVAAGSDSLTAAVRWSYDRLPPAHRAVFRQLCAFHGGFTAEAAGAVVRPAGPGVTIAVRELCNASLLESTPEGRATRYWMYRTVQDFGRALDTAGRTWAGVWAAACGTSPAAGATGWPAGGPSSTPGSRSGSGHWWKRRPGRTPSPPCSGTATTC
ncbi:MAG TPA: hypothetical protein VD866_28590 [Urbifossiella sp.]|nr:hypothetical protein [Urbifossiella sp.]